MNTFDLTAAEAAGVLPSPARAGTTVATTAPHRARASAHSRRRLFRARALWLQATVFALALGAGLLTGYLLNR